MRVFRLVRDRFGHKAGSEVYEYMYNDYGMASMDSFFTQLKHISITTDPSGNNPFFTIPMHDLEEIGNV